MNYTKYIPTVLRMGLIALVLMAFKCSGQCWEDIPLIRKDTVLSQGMYVIEPPAGKRAKIVFEDIPATIHEVFQTSGSWTKATNTADPFLNNDVYFSNQTGATLILNFYGSHFQVVTAKDKHHGICTIQLNSGPEVPVDLYSSARMNDVVVYDSPSPLGTNTVKIKVTGTKNPAATANYVVVDFVRVK